MKDILIMSRHDFFYKTFFEDMCNGKGIDLISISDTNREKRFARKLWLQCKGENDAAIFLNFRDVEGIESGFTEAKADQIVRFCQKTFDKKNTLVIHCFAGVSRSGAVAKWANEYFMHMNPYWDEYKAHNHYVYCMLDEAAYQILRTPQLSQ